MTSSIWRLAAILAADVAGVDERRELGVEVRRVVGERQARGSRQVPGFAALQVEQRPHHPTALSLKPAKRPRAGRDGEPVEDRLGEVGARVAGCDDSTAHIHIHDQRAHE